MSTQIEAVETGSVTPWWRRIGDAASEGIIDLIEWGVKDAMTDNDSDASETVAQPYYPENIDHTRQGQNQVTTLDNKTLMIAGAGFGALLLTLLVLKK